MGYFTEQVEINYDFIYFVISFRCWFLEQTWIHIYLVTAQSDSGGSEGKQNL